MPHEISLPLVWAHSNWQEYSYFNRNFLYGKESRWCQGGYFLFQNVNVPYKIHNITSLTPLSWFLIIPIYKGKHGNYQHKPINWGLFPAVQNDWDLFMLHVSLISDFWQQPPSIYLRYLLVSLDTIKKHRTCEEFLMQESGCGYIFNK